MAPVVWQLESALCEVGPSAVYLVFDGLARTGTDSRASVVEFVVEQFLQVAQIQLARRAARAAQDACRTKGVSLLDVHPEPRENPETTHRIGEHEASARDHRLIGRLKVRGGRPCVSHALGRSLMTESKSLNLAK